MSQGESTRSDDIMNNMNRDPWETRMVILMEYLGSMVISVWQQQNSVLIAIGKRFEFAPPFLYSW